VLAAVGLGIFIYAVILIRRRQVRLAVTGCLFGLKLIDLHLRGRSTRANSKVPIEAHFFEKWKRLR
jgi:hypothetical protein